MEVQTCFTSACTFNVPITHFTCHLKSLLFRSL
uniref:Uncharacterized protein n=1 Tax=Rhizophora mucronata TaxID=61149 RepID=A0A2P2QT56_RHIMU